MVCRRHQRQEKTRNKVSTNCFWSLRLWELRWLIWQAAVLDLSTSWVYVSIQANHSLFIECVTQVGRAWRGRLGKFIVWQADGASKPVYHRPAPRPVSVAWCRAFTVLAEEQRLTATPRWLHITLQRGPVVLDVALLYRAFEAFLV